MRRWIAFVAVASLLIIASCGGSSDPAGPDPESDPINPVLDPIREILAGPAGGELDLAEGDVELNLPAGAVTEEVILTADPVEPPPESEVGERPVAVFDLGPDGFEFDEPIELTFTYDPDVITNEFPDIVVEDLALFTLDDNGIWVLLEGVSVDTENNSVSGFTDHFSLFGILTVTRVCSGEYADVQAAYDATIPGGMIEICDGTHSVEGVVLDAPVTIRAEAGASPALETSVALSTFFLDGYTSGTVVIEGLTFNFSTPYADAADRATLSYAIRGTGTYDQLIVRNSTFNVDPVSRGSVFFWNNTETGSGVLVENTTFNGGVFGVAVFQAGPDTRLDVRNSQFSGTGSTALFYSAASGRVEGSTFENCGSVACVSVSGGTSAVELVSNDFTGSELTGESVPDLNELVRVFGGSGALLDDNDMVGCGYFQCVGVDGVGTDVTTSNNRLTFVPGRLYNEFNAMIRYQNDATGLIEGNMIDGCHFHCIQGTFRANITVRGNQVTIPAEQTAGFGIHGFGGEDPADSPTLVIEDNTIIADMTGVVPSDLSTFRITGAGIEMDNATATVYRNTIVGAARGVIAWNGGQVTAGEDNVIDQSHWGVMIQDVANVNLSFNDITNSFFSIFDADFASDLRCNWWGDPLGPGSNIDGAVDLGTYSPWATAPIAEGDHSICDPEGDQPPPPPPPDTIAPPPPPPDTIAVCLDCASHTGDGLLFVDQNLRPDERVSIIERLHGILPPGVEWEAFDLASKGHLPLASVALAEQRALRNRKAGRLVMARDVRARSAPLWSFPFIVSSGPGPNKWMLQVRRRTPITA